MFDWFDKTFRRREYPTWKDVPAWNKVNDDMDKVANDMSKVIQFPELKAVPAPEPEPEKPSRVFYRLGLTDDNRVAISMYYGEITLSRRGVQQMIDQLECFKNQLIENEEVEQ